MPRVIHFEIHASDPERAVRFYSGVFGWSFEKWQGPVEYWLIGTGSEGPGINGGLLRRHGPAPEDETPVAAYVCTLDVASVEEATAKIEQAGGRIVVPKMPVPGIGWLAYAKDTEGNVFGVLQEDREAR